MIEVKNVSKQFNRLIENKERKKFQPKSKKEAFLAVNDLSIIANEGEIVGILGPNGAGKSTLLRMMAGILQPNSGEISVNHIKMSENSDEAKRSIGFLSGNTKLYQRLTPNELLATFGNIYGMSKEDIEKRSNEIFELLDMEEFKDNRIEHLSTGQVQRTSISRCLIHSPQVYIFDEPTLGLDILSSQAILDFMKQEKANGKTVIYSTHYMEEAENICDRIYMMHHGVILAGGSVKDIKKKTKTKNLRDTFLVLLADRGETHEL